MTADAETQSSRAVKEYSFSKAKLPKGLSYPLKRSLLDTALRSASVYDTVWYVCYSGHRYERGILRAHFHPEDFAAASGKVMLTVWAVPSGERKVTEQLLLRDGLPILCEWLARTKSAGNSWRGMVHIIDFERTDEALRVVELMP